MLLAHDVSGVHPLSCLSLSQREAIPSPGQIQRILGKSDGRGNLPGLHPIRPITVIRPSAFPTVGPPKFQSASRHKPAAVVSPNSWILASLRSKTLITNFPSPEQCCHLQASTAFEPVRPLGCGIADKRTKRLYSLSPRNIIVPLRKVTGILGESFCRHWADL